MPLHNYTKQIYEEVTDPSYIIRFLDYLIQKRFKRSSFTVKGIVAEPLITGVIKNTKTKEHYKSLAQFYNTVTGSKYKENDISLLAHINATKDYTVMRIICNMKEDDILGFFDQKYRAFLIYLDVLKQIKNYTNIHITDKINLKWNNKQYLVSCVKISDNDINPYAVFEFYEAYETVINGLYYLNDGEQYLITDS